MKILFSGFEPFGNMAYNPSADAVTALPDFTFGAEIHKIILPVEYGKASDVLLARAAEIRADAVVCIGYAKGRGAVTPELYARNLRKAALADNGGMIYDGEKIFADTPEILNSALPCEKIVSACEKSGIPARLSEDCGLYVCNDLFYNLMYRGYGIRGFIHVSDLTIEQNKAALLCAVKEIKQ